MLIGVFLPLHSLARVRVARCSSIDEACPQWLLWAALCGQARTPRPLAAVSPAANHQNPRRACTRSGHALHATSSAPSSSCCIAPLSLTVNKVWQPAAACLPACPPACLLALPSACRRPPRRCLGRRRGRQAGRRARAWHPSVAFRRRRRAARAHPPTPTPAHSRRAPSTTTRP